MNLRSWIKTTRLSWREHKGVQFATLVVLSATFTVVISFVSLTMNLRNLLYAWGDSVQVTAYLKEGVTDRDVSSVTESLKALNEFKDVTFVSKDEAKKKFAEQMASFAPNLVAATGMDNPFPASLQMTFPDQKDVGNLPALAEQIGKLPGVEDVSYGEDWIKNYSALVEAFKWGSWVVIGILVFGCLLVVSNSIRASIDRRREEIEILRFVGATDSMIRQPFVFEGAIMGGLATLGALSISYAFYVWQLEIVSKNLAFANVATHFEFLSPSMTVIVAFAGVVVGALGSYSCLFRVGALLKSGRGD